MGCPIGGAVPNNTACVYQKYIIARHCARASGQGTAEVSGRGVDLAVMITRRQPAPACSRDVSVRQARRLCTRATATMLENAHVCGAPAWNAISAAHMLAHLTRAETRREPAKMTGSLMNSNLFGFAPQCRDQCPAPCISAGSKGRSVAPPRPRPSKSSASAAAGTVAATASLVLA